MTEQSNAPIVRAPTVTEVDRIAALSDPIVRNLQITQCYFELSAALRYFDNFEQIVTAFKRASETLYEEGFAEDLGKYFGYNVDGSSGNDTIYGTDAEENMNGRGGNDKSA